MAPVNSFRKTLLSPNRAILRKCNNALHPDLYGHYREAKFTQTKHHWWWKANRVFDQLDVTRHHTGSSLSHAKKSLRFESAKYLRFVNFTGLVLFLEEDHYVAEDFLHLLALMQKRAAELCAKCNILSLGTYLKTFNYYTYTNINKVRSLKSCLIQIQNTPPEKKIPPAKKNKIKFSSFIDSTNRKHSDQWHARAALTFLLQTI